MIESKKIQRPRYVLVVDDQELNRDILGAVLEDEYEVLFAENGREAMEIIRAKADSLSVVMLDLMMPEMNGFEVMQAMRADERTSSIPVVVLTADKSAELRALQLGAADFITKPFDIHEIILARVGRIIELSEGRHLISAAEHDKLTGLYTRNFFFEYAERLYTYHPELRSDAIVVDIEQFHSLNDLHGREFGDRVLCAIADEIRAFLSETQGIACRPEADRFELYCAPQGDYRALLKRFSQAANRLSPRARIHLRMGVKRCSEGVEPVLMFDRARAACNMARGNFQNPLMFYNDDMRARALMNRRLLNDLNTAVKERQFRVFYQPKYAIQCDPPKLCSAEALVRWQHPELGMISPDVFIPLFEGNGLISVVDNFVWEEAARQVAAWKQRFGMTLPVSVNLSRADVLDASVVDRFCELAETYGLDHRDLKPEVTESAYTENAAQMLAVIERLRKLGFEIEMDDFGSGYSSLNMLSAMPIDVLKMDRKFIRNIEHSETDRRLVKLVLDIARFLEVPVVAEGVETQAQLELLRQLGCGFVQGYYFSPPIPPAEFEQLIEQKIAAERN